MDDSEHPLRRQSDVTDAPSPWEIARRLSELRKDTRESIAELRKDTKEGFTTVHEAITKIDFVPMQLYISERDHQDRRLAAMEEERKWSHRLTISTAVAAVASLLISFIASQGGF